MHDFAMRVLSAPLGKTHLFYVGQAGFIIKSSSGQLLAIDLYLSECVERFEKTDGFKRLLPHILFPDELRFDYIIATHPHLDHFDMDSIPWMMSNAGSRLFASVNCEQEVDRMRLDEERVSYIRPGDSEDAGDFHINFINCDHGLGAPDAVGAIITVDGFRICEAGDTCLRLDRADEYNSAGPLDVLIGPINGAFGNMNEREFARLCGWVGPGLPIPCHYGMFAAHGGDPGAFKKEMDEKYRDNRYLLMQVGESYVLGDKSLKVLFHDTLVNKRLGE